MKLFCSTYAKSDKEYVAFLKSRIVIYIVLGLLGLASIAASMVLSYFYEEKIHDFTEGFFMGVGGGLIAASIVFILRFRKLLKDDELRRKARIAINDERNIQINTEAMKVASFAAFIGIYIAIFIAAVTQPTLAIILSVIVFAVIIVYLIACFVLSKKL